MEYSLNIKNKPGIIFEELALVGDRFMYAEEGYSIDPVIFKDRVQLWIGLILMRVLVKL